MIAAVAVIALVTGCSGGTANDAERGQRADATRESVVDNLQATETWERINGTPDATPTPEP